MSKKAVLQTEKKKIAVVLAVSLQHLVTYTNKWNQYITHMCVPPQPNPLPLRRARAAFKERHIIKSVAVAFVSNIRFISSDN